MLRSTAAGPAPGAPRVIILSGPDAGTRMALGEELLVGRGRGAGLRLRDPAASRRHARIRLGPEGITAEDLGAKNRLRLNGKAAGRGAFPLRREDRLTVGRTVLACEEGDRTASPRQAGPAEAPRDPRRRRADPLAAALAAVLAAVAAALWALSSSGW
jgi:hypothetical protein